MQPTKDLLQTEQGLVRGIKLGSVRRGATGRIRPRKDGQQDAAWNLDIDDQCGPGDDTWRTSGNEMHQTGCNHINGASLIARFLRVRPAVPPIGVVPCVVLELDMQRDMPVGTGSENSQPYNDQKQHQGHSPNGLGQSRCWLISHIHLNCHRSFLGRNASPKHLWQNSCN